MSLPIDEVLSTLRDHITDNALLQKISQDLTKVEQELKDAKEPAAKGGKTRLAILIRGDKALAAAVAGGAYVMGVPDAGDTDAVESSTYMGDALINRLRKAVVTHNEAPKGKRGKKRAKIETWFQAFSTLRPKAIKESGSQMTIKQKGVPAEVIVLLNENVSDLTP